jgi:hypothetical protein
MAWVTWRQHRLALGAVAVLLGAMALWLWIAGVHLHHAFAAATACHPAGSLACGELADTFNGMDNFLRNGLIPQVVPPLVGAFVGAPLLSRELETGTFRFAWTQGFGRRRWALAKLVGLAVVASVAAGAVSVLLSWYYAPYLATGTAPRSLFETSPFTPGLFDLRGVAFSAWTLTAFAIGGLVGALVRRVVPAIAATLVTYAGLAVAAAGLLRRHYLPPLVTSTLDLPASAWNLGQWGTLRGRVAFTGFPPIELLQRFCPNGPPGKGPSKFATLGSCLSGHGYTLSTSYQPASRFWPFQWIEGGWLLMLSALLIAATMWMVRRRAS